MMGRVICFGKKQPIMQGVQGVRRPSTRNRILGTRVLDKQRQTDYCLSKIRVRKDGGHKPPHTDPRSLEPHGYVPGVLNTDGTPFIYRIYYDNFIRRP